MSHRVIITNDENGNQPIISVSKTSALAVTPNDGTSISTTKAIYVGGAGDLKVNMADGTTITFPSLPVGMYDLAVKKVYATGTTAINIIALY